MIVKTDVKEVQVYRRSATITRGGEAILKQGRNIIFIAGMTASADQDTFRLKFPEGIRAINIQIVNISAAVDRSELASLAAEKKIMELSDRISTCEMMRELRKANSDFSNRSDVSIEDQENAMAELPGQMLLLHKQIEELKEEKYKIEEEHKKAVAEEEKPLIMAEIEAEAEGTVPFLLLYQDSECFWNPKYEIQYINDKEPLDVKMKAQIRQSSGENWKQVKVTLYTGNPSVSNALPEMSTIELSFFDMAKPRIMAKGNGRAMGAMCAPGAMADTADGMMDGEALMGMSMPVNMLKMDTAIVSEEETMTAFSLPNRRDILSDTDGNIADLQSFTVKAFYHVLSIPSVDNSAYLTAEIVASDWPLPPASASIYLGDTFAGDVFVDADSDTNLFNLSLGKDERINVVRNENPKKTQDVFLKGTKRQLCGSEIRLVNTSGDTVKVIVKDQIPVSSDKAITVETTELSNGLLEEETGEVKWELDAEPDKTVELKLEYNITWPKDKRITESRRVMKTITKFCQNCGRPVTGRFCPECGAVVK